MTYILRLDVDKYLDVVLLMYIEYIILCFDQLAY
jgi:hypothetical protein